MMLKANSKKIKASNLHPMGLQGVSFATFSSALDAQWPIHFIVNSPACLILERSKSLCHIQSTWKLVRQGRGKDMCTSGLVFELEQAWSGSNMASMAHLNGGLPLLTVREKLSLNMAEFLFFFFNFTC